VFKTKVDGVNVLNQMNLVAPEELRPALLDMLIDDGTLGTIDQYRIPDEKALAPPEPAPAAALPPPGQGDPGAQGGQQQAQGGLTLIPGGRTDKSASADSQQGELPLDLDDHAEAGE
jgi:hypothetical protein